MGCRLLNPEPCLWGRSPKPRIHKRLPPPFSLEFEIEHTINETRIQNYLPACQVKKYPFPENHKVEDPTLFAGGGRGGYMVALTPDTDCRIAVAATMEKEGYHVIRAALHGQ